MYNDWIRTQLRVGHELKDKPKRVYEAITLEFPCSSTNQRNKNNHIYSYTFISLSPHSPVRFEAKLSCLIFMSSLCQWLKVSSARDCTPKPQQLVLRDNESFLMQMWPPAKKYPRAEPLKGDFANGGSRRAFSHSSQYGRTPRRIPSIISKRVSSASMHDVISERGRTAERSAARKCGGWKVKREKLARRGVGETRKAREARSEVRDETGWKSGKKRRGEGVHIGRRMKRSWFVSA